MVRELEDNNLQVINAMFHYKLLHHKEDIIESDKLANEFKNGLIDPNKINSKF